VFIGFNTWYSASRVAPLALAAGVQAAIGFSTDFSDPLAESLFSNFYRYWHIDGGNMLASFLEAWKSLPARSAKLKGTGVVLWSRTSLVQKLAPKPARPRARAKGVAAAAESSWKVVSDKAEKERNTDLPRDESLLDVVSINVKPLKRINYSLLHNNGNLFEEFVVRKQKPGRVRGMEVEVRLHVGQDSFPFRRTFDLTEEALPLRDQIRLPLTSSLIRRVDENLATTIYVKVACAGQTTRTGNGCHRSSCRAIRRFAGSCRAGNVT
jgi:hypothetical protein